MSYIGWLLGHLEVGSPGTSPHIGGLDTRTAPEPGTERMVFVPRHFLNKDCVVQNKGERCVEFEVA